MEQAVALMEKLVLPGGLLYLIVVAFLNRKDTKQINSAVNHKGEDEPTLRENVKQLVETVDRIEERQVTSDRRAERVERKVDDLADDFERHAKNDDTVQDRLHAGQAEILRRLDEREG